MFRHGSNHACPLGMKSSTPPARSSRGELCHAQSFECAGTWVQ
jgi:hypothetical protein